MIYHLAKGPFVLASASPRRKELIALLGIPFTVVAADIDEQERVGEDPAHYVTRLAMEKAHAVEKKKPNAVVLAGDTTVVLDGAILGKPGSPDEAVAMLHRLSGKTHDVISAFAVVGHDISLAECFRSHVTFARISDEEIKHYVASKEPMDKAGAYGIQEFGSLFVRSVTGSFSNVVGLNIEAVRSVLLQHGVITVKK